MGQTSCSSEILENLEFRSGGARQWGKKIRHHLKPLKCRTVANNVEFRKGANTQCVCALSSENPISLLCLFFLRSPTGGGSGWTSLPTLIFISGNTYGCVGQAVEAGVSISLRAQSKRDAHRLNPWPCGWIAPPIQLNDRVHHVERRALNRRMTLRSVIGPWIQTRLHPHPTPAASAAISLGRHGRRCL